MLKAILLGLFPWNLSSPLPLPAVSQGDKVFCLFVGLIFLSATQYQIQEKEIAVIVLTHNQVDA